MLSYTIQSEGWKWLIFCEVRHHFFFLGAPDWSSVRKTLSCTYFWFTQRLESCTKSFFFLP